MGTCLRLVIDFALLAYLTARLGMVRRAALCEARLLPAAALTAVLVAASPLAASSRGAASVLVLVALLGGWALAGWFLALDDRERRALRQWAERPWALFSRREGGWQ